MEPYQQFIGGSATNPYQVPAMPQMPNIPTGLYGSEQSLNAGYGGALSGIQQGMDTARQQIMQQAALGNQQLMQGLGSAQGYAGQAMNLLGQPAAQAQAGSADTSGVTNSINQGMSALNQFLPQGQQAYNLQAALTGALGQPAQQQAFQNYTDSPGQQFLRDQGMRAITQNARAMGGIGGNQLKELQNYGTGLAAQNFQQNFNNLGSLSSIGANMAQGQAQLQGQQASTLGSLAGQALAGQNQANLYNAQAQNQNRSAIADILSGLGTASLGVGRDQFSNTNNIGANLANIFNTGGQNMANYAYNTGVNLAGGRMQTGQNIANLQSAQGQNLANMLGANATNVGNLISGTGQEVNSQQGQLAQLLAGLYGQNAQLGGNQTSVGGLLGQQGGYLKDLANVAQGFSTAAAAF